MTNLTDSEYSIRWHYIMGNL